MPLISQGVRHRCRLYGLIVEANRELFGSTAVSNAAQPDISADLVGRPDLPEDFPNLRSGSWREIALPSSLQSTPSGFRLFTREAHDQPLIGLRVPAGAEFVYTSDACRIWATWPPLISADFAAALLLNVGMAFNLRLRGWVCLHASAVVVNGGAVLFIGASGKGKSTLAALFASRGHPVLTDDIAALRRDESGIWVQPGYPALRLYPEPLRAFGAERRISPIAPDWDKFLLHVDADGLQFAQQPAPLVRIYLLAERGEQPSLEPISPLTAIPLLMENNYLAPVSQLQDYQRDFAVLAASASVPVRALSVPDGIDKLPSLYDIVISDLT